MIIARMRQISNHVPICKTRCEPQKERATEDPSYYTLGVTSRSHQQAELVYQRPPSLRRGSSRGPDHCAARKSHLADLALVQPASCDLGNHPNAEESRPRKSFFHELELVPQGIALPEASQARRTEHHVLAHCASHWLVRDECERCAIVGWMFFCGKDQELVHTAGVTGVDHACDIVILAPGALPTIGRT
jgi:hypothetical protein